MSKYYAVKAGYNPGIYTTWAQAEKEVKGFPGATFKSFSTRQEALAFLGNAPRPVTTQKVIYTDGSSKQGYAGWAYIVVEGDKIIKERAEALPYPSTNNEAELTAILMALKENPNILTIYSDSQYCIKSITDWSKVWQKNGWKTSQGKPVQNQEYIKEILSLVTPNHQFIHVYGHTGNVYNERCDQLASIFYP